MRPSNSSTSSMGLSGAVQVTCADALPASTMRSPARAVRTSANLADAGQQDFSENVIGGASALIVVAGCDNRPQLMVGKHDESLAAIADRGDITRPLPSF